MTTPATTENGNSIPADHDKKVTAETRGDAEEVVTTETQRLGEEGDCGRSHWAPVQVDLMFLKRTSSGPHLILWAAISLFSANSASLR
jgi:hypothetical protein